MDDDLVYPMRMLAFLPSLSAAPAAPAPSAAAAAPLVVEGTLTSSS